MRTVTVIAEAASVRPKSDRFAGLRSPRGRVFLGSALMLFLELALIRWLGANVVHLSYFSNFVLLGSFLGIGLGFLASGKRPGLALRSSPRCSPSAGRVRHARFPVESTAGSDRVIYFTSVKPTGPPAWIVLPVIFLASRRRRWARRARRAELPRSAGARRLPARPARLPVRHRRVHRPAFLGLPPLVVGARARRALRCLLGTARLVTLRVRRC